MLDCLFDSAPYNGYVALMERKKQKQSFADQLRRHIDEADVTRYRLAKDCDIDHATMSRFMNGQRGLSFEAIEKLVERLNLALVTRI